MNNRHEQVLDNRFSKLARKRFILNADGTPNPHYGKDTMIVPDGVVCEIIEDDGRKPKR
jgi:hypothetical protein